MANDKILVLVADDEPSTRALVIGHLKRRGYKVIEASDGDEAWELAHEHLPHLVVLDVMMPGMSGWEVCRKIREAVSLAHTGVVMLTGIGENLNEMTSPLYGADAYVDKPFEFSVLDAKIQETLARRQAGAMGRGDEESLAAAAEQAAAPKPKKKAAKKKAAPKKEATPAAVAPEAAAPKKAAPKKKAAKKAAPKKKAAKAAPKKKAAKKKAAPKKAAPTKAAPEKKAARKKAAAKKAAPKRKAAKKTAAPKKAAKKKAAPKKAAKKKAAKKKK